MLSSKSTFSLFFLFIIIQGSPEYYFCVDKCQSNEILYNGKCYCPAGYFSVDGHCTQCRNGQFFDQAGLRCVSFCQENAFFIDGSCRCRDHFYPIEGKCQSCPRGTYYRKNWSKCVDHCSNNQIQTFDGCVCKEGFFKINGECQQCPSNSIYSQDFEDCICPEGQMWSNVVSKCVENCGNNEDYFNGYCQCKQSYYIIDGSCQKCSGRGLYYSSTQECICPFGFYYENGCCKPKCSERQYFDELIGHCVSYCSQYTQVWINEECQCAEGFYRDQESGICYPSCGPFEIRINEVCTCIKGYHKGISGICVPIQCPYGTRWISDKRQCRSICAGENQHLVNDVCVCVTGFAREDTVGLCLPECGNGKLRKNGKCQCPGGNKEINGECTKCPQYTQYVNGVCLCYNGKLPYFGRCQFLSCPDRNQVWDPIFNVCKCKKPLSWLFGQCRYIEQCGLNQYWSGSQCVCRYGYFKIGGVCQKVDEDRFFCPPNSAFNGVNCLCLPDFYPVNPGKCEKCPDNYHWNGYECKVGDYACAPDFEWDLEKDRCSPINQCGENQFWDGAHCRCKMGYFYIDFKCQSCEYGKFFDGFSCSDVVVPSCNDPYKFWNGKECVCLSGYFEVQETCVKCPEYTYWNGVCCKPKTGFTVELTVAGYD